MAQHNIDDAILTAKLARVLMDGHEVTPAQAAALAGERGITGARAMRILDALVTAGVATKSKALDGAWRWRLEECPVGDAAGNEETVS